jgi:membrane protein required for colicin V production
MKYAKIETKNRSNVFLYLCVKQNLDMNKLDLILLIPIGLGFVFGLFKGLIKEITSLAAIVLGIYGAKLLAPFISNVLIHSFEFSPKTALPMSYLILFVIIALGLLMVAKSLEKIFDSISLGALNKFFGGIFGALKYALIVSVLLIIFNAIDSRFSMVSAQTKENSIAYKPLMKLAPALWDEAKKEHQSSHE